MTRRKKVSEATASERMSIVMSCIVCIYLVDIFFWYVEEGTEESRLFGLEVDCSNAGEV